MGMLTMKDLSYLQAFSPKILREAQRILNKGFTAEDIDNFLNTSIEIVPVKNNSFLQKPCCNDVDEKLEKFKRKQKEKKKARSEVLKKDRKK
jgi:hypothetical protein